MVVAHCSLSKVFNFMCVIAPRALDEILGFRRSFWKGIVGYIRNIISRAEGVTSRFEARVSGKLKISICTYIFFDQAGHNKSIQRNEDCLTRWCPEWITTRRWWR